ncbi:MAG: exosortase C-terminal domain/associated protein EpsI [Desulfuromonadaceae bacterium]
MHRRFYILYILIILTALFVGTHRDIAVPVAHPLKDIPSHFDAWSQADDIYFSEAVLAQLRPTDYLYRVYQHDANQTQKQSIGLYIGYHDGGSDSGPIHSPKHCLPGSGWMVESEATHILDVGADTLKVVEAVYRNGERRELFMYWYQVSGATLTNEYALKFAEIFNSIVYGRRDSAFVRISTQYREGDEKPVALLRDFVREVYPLIKEVLPQ